MMKFPVIVERGPTSLGAYVPDLPGCVAAGSTRYEVIALIQEAIEFHIDGMRADGLSIHAPASLVAYVDVAA